MSSTRRSHLPIRRTCSILRVMCHVATQKMPDSGSETEYLERQTVCNESLRTEWPVWNTHENSMQNPVNARLQLQFPQRALQLIRSYTTCSLRDILIWQTHWLCLLGTWTVLEIKRGGISIAVTLSRYFLHQTLLFCSCAIWWEFILIPSLNAHSTFVTLNTASCR